MKTRCHKIFLFSKTFLHKTREIDRGLGRYVERFSRYLWPWREKWLVLLVGTLVVLDFSSTYLLLVLSKKDNFYESGLLAAWALDRGGFAFLLLIDIVAAVFLSLAAFTVRYLYNKQGFYNYGRTAFVFLLFPYIAFTVLAIANNIILLLR